MMPEVKGGGGQAELKACERTGLMALINSAKHHLKGNKKVSEKKPKHQALQEPEAIIIPS